MNISMREAEVAARAELELAMKTPDLATIAAAVSKMQAIDASEALIQEGLAFVRALHSIKKIKLNIKKGDKDACSTCFTAAFHILHELEHHPQVAAFLDGELKALQGGIIANDTKANSIDFDEEDVKRNLNLAILDNDLASIETLASDLRANNAESELLGVIVDYVRGMKAIRKIDLNYKKQNMEAFYKVIESTKEALKNHVYAEPVLTWLSGEVRHFEMRTLTLEGTVEAAEEKKVQCRRSVIRSIAMENVQELTMVMSELSALDASCNLLPIARDYLRAFKALRKLEMAKARMDEPDYKSKYEICASLARELAPDVGAFVTRRLKVINYNMQKRRESKMISPEMGASASEKRRQSKLLAQSVIFSDEADETVVTLSPTPPTENRSITFSNSPMKRRVSSDTDEK